MIDFGVSENPVDDHTMSMGEHSQMDTASDRNMPELKKPMVSERFTGNHNLIIRQFIIVRMRVLEEGEETEGDLMESHYADVELLASDKEIQEGKLRVQLNFPQLDIQLHDDVVATDIVPKEDLHTIFSNNKEVFTKRLLEKLVV